MPDSIAYRSSILATHLAGYLCRDEDFLYIYIPRQHGDFYVWCWGDEWQGSEGDVDLDSAITFPKRSDIAQWIEDMKEN